MELKHCTTFPLPTLLSSLNRTFYGIETVLLHDLMPLGISLNRTFYGIETQHYRHNNAFLNQVLIVPFMELKLRCAINDWWDYASLNRTFYGIETNLLFSIKFLVYVLIVPFMELKRL